MADQTDSHIQDILDNEPEAKEEPILLTEVAESLENGQESGADLRGAASRYYGIKDKHGRPFDPKIHKTNPDGSPCMQKGGEFVSIKAWVRKPGPSSKIGEIPNHERELKEVSERKASALSASMAGKIATRMTFALGQGMGGVEWKPMIDKEQGINEAEFLEGAYTGYFELKGGSDLSPSWVLVIALGCYVIPRLTMPNTQKRFGSIGQGIKRFFGWFKRKFNKNGSQLDIGHDRERQDDTGQEVIEGPKDERAGRYSF